MSSSIPIDELKQIKLALEEKMNESYDTDYSDNSTKPTKKKKTIITDYKSKYNSSESKYRYLQLELSNKEIEISELKEQLVIFEKHKLLIKNVNFLFDRLDNAFKILHDRINTINDSHIIKLNTITYLQTLENLCLKTKDKYEEYINNSVYPLFLDDQIIFKNSITLIYSNKIKEFNTIQNIIKIKKYNTQFNNTGIIILISFLVVFMLQLIISVIYYFILK